MLEQKLCEGFIAVVLRQRSLNLAGAVVARAARGGRRGERAVVAGLVAHSVRNAAGDFLVSLLHFRLDVAERGENFRRIGFFLEDAFVLQRGGGILARFDVSSSEFFGNPKRLLLASEL